MSQLPLFTPPSWTVTDVTRYLRSLFDGDEQLQDLWVLGEISNFTRSSNGHLYFTLKDSAAALRCVMWRNAAARLPFSPRDGDAIEVHGLISIYEQSGQYQLYADQMRPAGEGALFQEFLRLKARLEAEGLFDPARKRALPRWPHCIGIVTSPTGAALRDMLNTLRRRYPLAEVVIAPTPVQGVEAPPGIIAALRALNNFIQPDVILLARGGGSIEDLWAFNDENVARAITASTAPVITGVGHETDFTIADFAADLRAPTPTAAAELATPHRADLQNELTDLTRLLERAARSELDGRRAELKDLQAHLRLHSPVARVRSDRQHLDDLTHRTGLAVAHAVQLERAHLNNMQQRLEALNPLSVLKRGFAMVSTPAGEVVRSITSVTPGARLTVRVSDGVFQVQVSRDGATGSSREAVDDRPASA
jgi:exodeoxyribonuclease VII large subunit